MLQQRPGQSPTEPFEGFNSTLQEARLYAGMNNAVSFFGSVNFLYAQSQKAGVAFPEKDIRESLDILCQKAGDNLTSALGFLEEVQASQVPFANDYAAGVRNQIPELGMTMLVRAKRTAKNSWRTGSAKVLEDVIKLETARAYGFEWPEGTKEALFESLYEKGVKFALYVANNYCKEGSKRQQKLLAKAAATAEALHRELPK